MSDTATEGPMRAIRLLLLIAAFAVLPALAGPATADEQQDATDFAKRVFADNLDKATEYACFSRHYDAEHLAEHPLQKVSVMRLLVSAERNPEDKTLQYSFRLGVNFRNRPGDFDSSGDCAHLTGEDAAKQQIDFGCGVDCDGGGFGIDLAKDNASVLVRLDQAIRIWKGKNNDEDVATELKAGADDKMFHLDRANVNECASLAMNRKELAAMRHK
jgi:hypothetical protein